MSENKITITTNVAKVLPEMDAIMSKEMELANVKGAVNSMLVNSNAVLTASTIMLAQAMQMINTESTLFNALLPMVNGNLVQSGVSSLQSLAGTLLLIGALDGMNTKLFMSDYLLAMANYLLFVNFIAASFDAGAIVILTEQLSKLNEELAKAVIGYTFLNLLMLQNGILAGAGAFALLAQSTALKRQTVGLAVNTAAVQTNNTANAFRLITLGTTVATAKGGFVLGLVAGAALSAFVMSAAMLARSATPALAKGGVTTGPTYALIGEGKYNEAVVPLGNSPQFNDMKSEIANAVLNGIYANKQVQGKAENSEVILNIDGEKFARAILPSIEKENKRKGYSFGYKGV